MPKPSVFNFGVAVEKLRRHKSPGIKISAKLIKAGDRTIRFETHKLINSIWNKEKLPVERKESRLITLSTTCKIFSNILL